jgi:hypothetical protein
LWLFNTGGRHLGISWCGVFRRFGFRGDNQLIQTNLWFDIRLSFNFHLSNLFFRRSILLTDEKNDHQDE